MKTFTLIALGVIAQSQPDTELLMPDTSILSGFSLNRASRKLGAAVIYRRTVDYGDLAISARTIADDQDIDEWWDQVSTMSLDVPNRPVNPRSGLPLADRCIDNKSGRGGLLVVMSGRTSISVLLNVPTPSQGDLDLQEGAARYAVAKIYGIETLATGDVTVSGRRVDQCRIGPSGTVLVPLDKWATATGVEVSWNKVRGTAEFTYSGESYIFALGSTKLKKGGKWWDCGDTLTWYGGHWYAPLSLLN